MASGGGVAGGIDGRPKDWGSLGAGGGGDAVVIAPGSDRAGKGQLEITQGTGSHMPEPTNACQRTEHTG